MTEAESRIEAIKLKMDRLGQMMYEWKQKQAAFEAAHRDELTEIAVRQDELKDEILRLGRSMESMKLSAALKYRREGKPYVAFSLRDEDSIADESRKASW